MKTRRKNNDESGTKTDVFLHPEKKHSHCCFVRDWWSDFWHWKSLGAFQTAPVTCIGLRLEAGCSVWKWQMFATFRQLDWHEERNFSLHVVRWHWSYLGIRSVYVQYFSKYLQSLSRRYKTERKEYLIHGNFLTMADGVFSGVLEPRDLLSFLRYTWGQSARQRILQFVWTGQEKRKPTKLTKRSDTYYEFPQNYTHVIMITNTDSTPRTGIFWKKNMSANGNKIMR